MLLVQDEAFNELFHRAKLEAFHLEVQDTYETPEESEPFRHFLSGRDDDYAWLRDWLDLVTKTTARGVRIKRARVVTVPHTDYVRWSLQVAWQNTRAGEEIRYLPRHTIDADKLTADDWWLFDNSVVGFTVFEPSGRWAGAAVTTDSRIVDLARGVKDQVWSAAIPLEDYANQ
ncbi:hypothetical protein IU500_28425 [Nocardia terpenica]|uniref:DUF6879 family protein n=1 Tax=Nocardia terpenica TaxID=455432 RepID=UPI00189560AC|nr:DUF6879 family protein [Nocardia terpenica]MBF6065213.1 hypothetical protein [Nocardia terpenica]MBF6107940.1 hypothetical protein [Nocardia terpenica]MBF6115529.1 hypothetical protein [Nocardia terpenica]MBF6121966.1 hypothetical protein [Nocardia terpenica]MBF6155490.1 hypothetical protein [Nocardia terpenica]